MKIALIGAGIFGCSVAIRLGENGFNCDLFDEKLDIMSCASRVNQYRFHKGYHYPRSISTVSQLKSTSGFFFKEYRDSINSDFKHYYSLSSKDSNVDKEYYLNFLNKSNLDHRILDYHPSIRSEASQLIIEVNEALIDYQRLKEIVRKKIVQNSNINLKLNTLFKKKFIDDYDIIINCSYGFSNEILPNNLKREYKYQLLEKIVVKPPKSLRNLSLVVVDGPFMCIDPIPNTELSILGNVKLAIHKTHYGLKPPEKIENNLKPWQDIVVSDKSRFKDFIDHGNEFISDFDKCIFQYSMVGYRVVLPNIESTDDRLTSVRKEGKFIDIFSGKIDTCCWAANRTLELIKEM